LRKASSFCPAGAALAGLAALAAASNKLTGWFEFGSGAAAAFWAGCAAAGAWAAGCGGGFCGNKCSGIPYFFQI